MYHLFQNMPAACICVFRMVLDFSPKEQQPVELCSGELWLSKKFPFICGKI
jgi:hypothetical protein